MEKMDIPSACRVLGVDPRASNADIRQAWRRMAQRYHPDRYKGADATARMQEINVAWGVLQQTTQAGRIAWLEWEERRRQEEAQMSAARTETRQDATGAQAPHAKPQRSPRGAVPHAWDWDAILLWLSSIHPTLARLVSVMQAIIWPDFVDWFVFRHHVYVDAGDGRVGRFHFGWIVLEFALVCAITGSLIGGKFGQPGHGLLIGLISGMALFGRVSRQRRAWFAFSALICLMWSWFVGSIVSSAFNGDAFFGSAAGIIAFILTMRAHRAAQYAFLSAE